MTLYLRNFWDPSKHKIGIAGAIEMQCESNEDDAVERAKETAANAVQLLGQLVEILHQKSIISTEEVMTMLPSFEVVE